MHTTSREFDFSPIEVSLMDRETFLRRYEQAVRAGGDSGYFLGTAFVSWYRGQPSDRVDLSAYMQLDGMNRELFQRMLELRSGNWSDERLFELETVCRKVCRLPLGPAGSLFV